MPGPRFHNTSARGHFGDSLAALDWSVGRVLETLANTGVRITLVLRLFYSSTNITYGRESVKYSLSLSHRQAVTS